jgi:hypothetical protein
MDDDALGIVLGFILSPQTANDNMKKIFAKGLNLKNKKPRDLELEVSGVLEKQTFIVLY